MDAVEEFIEEKQQNDLTSREIFIVDNLKIDPSTVKLITEIGRLSGTHKYDVWIAREIKKNSKLINKQRDFQFILDWIQRLPEDINKLSFEEAYKKSDEWHKNLPVKEKKKEEFKKIKEEVQDVRVIYKCKDQKHSFILLKPEELDREGSLMNHCVATYKSKLKSGNCLIISLRDDQNNPYVTIELDTHTGRVIQIRGNSNQNPSLKYLKLIHEFALYSTGHGENIDKELVELMNTNFE